MRILIVDDDEATRLCLSRLLQDLGPVDTAADGHQAIERFGAALAEGRPYGLVCMDINMPKVDGQQALKRLRELEAGHGVAPGRECKVVMASAHCDTGNVCQAYFHGQADGFLKKPLRIGELRQELQSLGIPLG